MALALAVGTALSLPATLSGANRHAKEAASTSPIDWRQIGSYTRPSIRTDMVMTAAPNGQVLLFGGVVWTAIVRDTWTYDGTRWTEQHPAVSPSPRGYAAAAYDAGRRLVVVFGGSTSGPPIADTWTWNGSAWTEQHPAHSPPARWGARMAYDPATEKVVLFGGSDSSGIPLGDTWTWDGTDWTRELPVASPTPRFFFAFADGTATSEPMLFGGLSYGSQPVVATLADTWTWDGPNGTWLPQAAAGPVPRAGALTAYDPTLRKTVLFGGYALGPDAQVGPDYRIITTQTEYGDTWVWDRGTWVELNPPAAPTSRFRGGIAFNVARSKLQLFGGWATRRGPLNDTWRFDGLRWLQEDLNAPRELHRPMLARESSPGTAILFGGQTEVEDYALNDTWRWDGSRWQLLAPSTSPPPRSGGAMVFDNGLGVTVLFGGVVDYPGPTSYYVASDTWTWDGTDWTEHHPAVSPPGRDHPSIAYDAARGEVVLFGGGESAGALGDTWTWDGQMWTQESPPHSPPPRFAAAMAYDPLMQTVVLFGGSESDSAGWLGDTWTWDGNDWAERSPPQSPAPRAYAVMAYDPLTTSLVLFGGCSECFGNATYDDTWSWSGQTWTQVETATVPFERTDAAAVDGDANSPLLMFGGRRTAAMSYATGTQLLNDLWAVSSSQPTAVQVVSFTARSSGTAVVLRWRTVSEGRAAGFNIYRSRAGRLVKVNRALIPGKGRAGGATYALIDPRPARATSYRLQVVGLDGSRTWRGTARARH